MPNHCTNYLTLTVDNPKKFKKIATILSEEAREDHHSTPLLQYLAPLPRKAADDSWNDHCNKHWGTKWDIFEVMELEGDEKSVIKIEFSTAWSPPIQALKTAKIRHGIEYELYYDEPGMDFMGYESSDELRSPNVIISEVYESFVRGTMPDILFRHYQEELIEKYNDDLEYYLEEGYNPNLVSYNPKRFNGLEIKAVFEHNHLKGYDNEYDAIRELLNRALGGKEDITKYYTPMSVFNAIKKDEEVDGPPILAKGWYCIHGKHYYIDVDALKEVAYKDQE